MGAFYWRILGFIPKEEDKYNFTFDGEIHENVSFIPFKTSGNYIIYYIGNMHIVDEDYKDTGENYLCYVADSGEGYAAVYCFSTEGEHTVSLELTTLPIIETVHKLNSKYVDAPYVVESNGDIVFNNDVYSNNIDILQSTIGESLSDKLYKHYRIDKNEYPYIYITANGDGTGSLVFSIDNPSLGSSYFYAYNGSYSINYQGDGNVDGATLESVINVYLDFEPEKIFYTEGTYSTTPKLYNYINFSRSVDGFTNYWKIFDENTIIEDIYQIKSEMIQPVQSDYNQNNSASLDYIKNRPFYVEKKVTNDPSQTQTIYDSINSDSSSATYNSTGYDYTSTNIVDTTLKDYLMADVGVNVIQKITKTGSGKGSTNSYYYITRSGTAKKSGNDIYIGNLYMHTHDSNDSTDEDYVLYYNNSTGQLTLHLLSSTACDDGTVVSTHFSTSNQTVDLTISISAVFEDIYHKIDPNFLPNMPYTTDDENNAVFEGTITAKKFIVSSEDDEEAGRTSQTYVILTDIENNLDYAVQMKGGYLVTLQLPTEVQITTLPDKITYYRGDYFDPTGMVITATCPDGSTRIIEDYTISNSDISFDTVGEIEIIIKAKIPTIYKLTLTVTVNEFDPDVVLTDFTYTTNDDGTYTLTGWNETLNGESSTELIVPNNSLIVV